MRAGRPDEGREPAPTGPPPASLRSLLWLLAVLAVLGGLIALVLAGPWSRLFSVSASGAGVLPGA